MRDIYKTVARSSRDGKKVFHSIDWNPEELPFKEEEALSVLKAAYLLRIINKTPPKTTPRWAHYREREKAKGRDPNPVEFMKSTYKEWYEVGVLYAGMIDENDRALYDALVNYARNSFDKSLGETDIFPSTKRDIQFKRLEILSELLNSSPSEAMKFGTNLRTLPVVGTGAGHSSGSCNVKIQTPNHMVAP
jgi:hypothetical protein